MSSKIGKISELILKRSVLKAIEQNKAGIEKGASVGADCAFFGNTAVANGYVAYENKKAVRYAIISACNNLRAGGAVPKIIELSISLPEKYREIKLKEIMKLATETCEELDIKLAGGHTEYVSELKNPIINVTALGETVSIGEKEYTKLDIVETKWLGLAGTAILAQNREEELINRLPVSFIRDAATLDQFISISEEAELALEDNNTVALHDVAGGGIYTAIWELCEKLGCGCRVDLKKIPVLQDTIEICEYYDINPYVLRGDGSLLILTTDGDNLVQKLIENNINAVVIGHTTEEIDRIIVREDEERYLEPGNGDELRKVL